MKREVPKQSPWVLILMNQLNEPQPLSSALSQMDTNLYRYLYRKTLP
jgi:hypothetical protein